MTSSYSREEERGSGDGWEQSRQNPSLQRALIRRASICAPPMRTTSHLQHKKGEEARSKKQDGEGARCLSLLESHRSEGGR